MCPLAELASGMQLGPRYHMVLDMNDMGVTLQLSKCQDKLPSPQMWQIVYTQPTDSPYNFLR